MSPGHDLARTRSLTSPRFAKPATPWRSTVIHAAVLALWVITFAFTFSHSAVLAWSVGAVYILYDTVLQCFVGWNTWRLLRPPPEVLPGPRSSLGVIIATYNEAAVLPATIAALLAGTDTPDLIVVADDGSDDETAPLLTVHYGLTVPAEGRISEPSATHPTLRWMRLPHGGKAAALNAAMVLVDSDIVLTVDADTLLDSKAIGAVRRAFDSEPELASVTGIITPVCKPTVGGGILEWFQTYEYIRNFLSRYAWMQVDSLLLISGAFAGFRRQAVVSVGGFDAECLVEDYELVHRMRRYAVARGLDWRFRVLGGAQARTEAPGSVGAFLRQRRRWFGGFLQTQYWYREMVGDKRYGWLGRLMLPVKAVDTLQPLYGLTAFVLLLVYAGTQRMQVVLPISTLIGSKIGIDLVFHLWSVHLYRRWVGDKARASLGWALLAAVAEPFTFQLLRHSGAALGWLDFITGQSRWGNQARFGLNDKTATERKS